MEKRRYINTSADKEKDMSVVDHNIDYIFKSIENIRYKEYVWTTAVKFMEEDLAPLDEISKVITSSDFRLLASHPKVLVNWKKLDTDIKMMNHLKEVETMLGIDIERTLDEICVNENTK